MKHRRAWPDGLLWAVVVGCAALLLASCTDEPEDEELPPPPIAEDEEPAPHLGAEIVVVLPPRTALAPEVARTITADLERLEDEFANEVRVVRTRFPDTPKFVRDVSSLAVREGADLLCVFGSVGRQYTSDLRDLHPAKRFCAVTPNDPPEEPEDGIDVIALRVVELGNLLGSAVVELADGEPAALALGPTELQRGRFTEGLLAALGTTEIIEPDSELPPDEAVAAAVADGAAVVLVGTGPDAALQTQAALDAGAHVITHASLVGPDDEVALTWNLRWDLALLPAIHHLLERQVAAQMDLGLTDGIFEVTIGAAAPPRLVGALSRVEEELRAGERDPFTTVEPEEPAEADDEEVPEEGVPEEDADPEGGPDADDGEGADEGE